MTGAMILMFLGALLYGVVALMFLAFSCAELLDAGRSNRGRLLLAIAAAAFWPVALVVASVAAVLMARPAGAGKQVRNRPVHSSDKALPVKRLVA